MRQRERWMQNHLKELELKVAAAPRTETSATGAKMSKADMLRYQEETKALLMQLRMLLHPDKLLQNPVFTRLSEEQKQSLEGLCGIG